MHSHYLIGSADLNLHVLQDIIKRKKRLKLDPEARIIIENSRKFLNKKINETDVPVYGINTGFGCLCNVKISSKDLARLQKNLVMSHACGTGDLVSKPIIRLMLLLKIQSLSYGNSGVAVETVQRLIDLYNEDVLPVIFEQGSLGASGDLAPLAHMALPLIGKGEVYFEGKRVQTEEVLKKFGWEPIELQSKEGLALLNGTQFMSAHGIYILLESYKLCYLANVISAASVDAFDCRISPFDEKIQTSRPHKGQVKTAELMRTFLEGSEIAQQEKTHVQDPYSFRCIPQVHGATRDTLDFVTATFQTEINSVTDNPLIFTESDEVISGGNFHGQPLALGLDYLSIAMAEIGSISERRIYQLISGQRELPGFLVDNPGLNSGFMIPQYTAASIVSQNKQYATPASIDSIVSSNGQEDHVSMGANGATKALKVVENISTILAIELFNASQALHYREPMRTSPFLEKILSGFREDVPVLREDGIMSGHIQKAKDFLVWFSVEEKDWLNQ